MASIITRAGKGSPLTHNEVDSNFIELGDRLIRTFPSRAAFVTASAITIDNGMKVETEGISYLVSHGATSIPDLPDAIPYGEPSPEHFGDVLYIADHTAAFTAWWAYLTSLAAVLGAQYANDGQVRGVLQSRRYKSTAGLVLTSSNTGFTVAGRGPTSQLDKIDFAFTGPLRMRFENFFMRGASPIALDFGKSGTSLARQSMFSNIWIRDKIDAGIVLNGSTWNMFTNIHLEKNQTNLRVEATSGDTFVDCIFVNSVGDNLDVQSGGELKLIGCTVMAAGYSNSGTGWVNLRLSGTASVACVENYFESTTFTLATQGGRKYAIASIADNGSGKLRITTTTAHELREGIQDVSLDGTANYDASGATDVVLAVISSTVFDLDRTYIASETVGEVWLPGWDVSIEPATAPQNVNDQFFDGGNINYLKISGGYNLNFIGTRLKSQIHIDSAIDSSRVMFIRNGRGRQTDSTADVPISGPGSAQGWAEIAYLDDTPGTFTVNGGERIAMRTPLTSAGVGADGIPVDYVSVSTYADGAKIKNLKFLDGSAVDGTGTLANGAQVEKYVSASTTVYKFVDGRMEMYSPAFSADATTATGTLFKWASNQTWTFPEVFFAIPLVAAGSTNNTVVVGVPSTAALGSVSVNVFSTVSLAGRTCNFVAHGRWRA